jgi:hypothetical protein
MTEQRTTINQAAFDAFCTSDDLRKVLDAAAFTITAHAVPHSGVDTGRLINSMGHEVEAVDGVLEAHLGSGLGDGVMPVHYWAYHWAGVPAPDQDRLPKPGPGESLPSRQNAPKASPTRPYSKALNELGVTYTVDGGVEA